MRGPGREDSGVDDELAARVEEVRLDREHGASFLARRALEALVAAVQRGGDPLEAARALAAARPAMGGIAAAVGRTVGCSRDAGRIVDEGRALLARSERGRRSIAVLLGDRRGRVLTHSSSATVDEVLSHAPGLERVHDLRSANLVLVGADAVFRDGSVVNAAGTRELARAAGARDIPVVVAAETLKLVPTDPVPPAEGEFDLTPQALVVEIATEEGVFTPPQIAALCDRTPFLGDGYLLVTSAGVPVS
jgi:translation initiation factor 2B subunit (eIF-2B alpha/beta/delta family)